MEFTDDFTVDDGANFTGEIAECQHGFFRMKSDSTEHPDQTQNTDKANTTNASSFLSPNPNNGKFNLQLKENTLSEIFIYNDMGQLVYQQKNNSSSQQIDLSAQPKGIYFVKVQSADKVYTEKVVVQ